jgi:hypothetical protein
MLKTIAEHIDRDTKSVRYEVTHHCILRIRANQRNKCGLRSSVQRYGYAMTVSLVIAENAITTTAMRSVQTSRKGLYACACKDGHMYAMAVRISLCANCQSSSTMPAEADRDHRHSVSDWKTGPRNSEIDMAGIIKAFQEGTAKGLSVDVIIAVYHLSISVATAYRYIDDHLIPGVKNIDLKRKSRYSARDTGKAKIIPKNHDWLEGRKYTDYLDRISADPSINVWQMDTVIGKHGSEEKCILTLLYTRTNLQLYFLLDACTAANVVTCL